MKEKKEINVQIGERIKSVRENCEYTQEKFSELIGVSAQYVSDVERGKVGVSLRTLKKICETLSVSSDWLLLGRQNSNSEISHIISQLENMDKKYLPVFQAIMNNYLEAIALSKK